ncbi:actin-related protein 8 [Aegilops tauschii subsp. strangulata]|uniref:F-box domain-containing protein n=1 Tax=Aegilops tauschii subsp. strangulata TaxID=200361 RepID=A0A453DCH1_AEGTS|nr:actin-related protein 8 [Aegilops tauschii subsp. strangulata]
MASTLLRKVWGSVLSRAVPRDPDASASSSSPRRRGAPAAAAAAEYGSLGALDAVPIDVLAQILRLLGPADAARSVAVCRTWRLLASDNALWAFFLSLGPDPWDLVVFAETHLAAGPAQPRSVYFGTVRVPPQLSFKRIYGQRALVPGSIIVDGGSGYCKYGWSKYAAPSGRCATFLEFGNIESPMYARLRHFFSTIYNRMHVKPSARPIVVALPLCHSDDTEAARASRKQYKETLYSVLFDMNVPAVCAVDQALLALYAARRTSGIVVNIGFNVTSVVPIFQGRVMREIGIETVGQGALKLTGFLKELLQRRNISFESLYTVRTIKEKICYVAADYEAELCKNTQASCEVDGEGWFTLSEERFKMAEILFQPQIGGVRAMALHKAVSLCMDHCYNTEVLRDHSWFKTVVLAGGSSCLPGLPERLEKELHKLLPPYISEGIRVLPPPFGTDTAWFGAKMIGTVSTFSDAWCINKKQFRQKSRHSGSSLVNAWR